MQDYKHISLIDRLPFPNDRIVDVIAVLIIGLGSGESCLPTWEAGWANGERGRSF